MAGRGMVNVNGPNGMRADLPDCMGRSRTEAPKQGPGPVHCSVDPSGNREGESRGAGDLPDQPQGRMAGSEEAGKGMALPRTTEEKFDVDKAVSWVRRECARRGILQGQVDDIASEVILNILRRFKRTPNINIIRTLRWALGEVIRSDIRRRLRTPEVTGLEVFFRGLSYDGGIGAAEDRIEIDQLLDQMTAPAALTVRLVLEHGGVGEAARHTGIPRSTLEARYRLAYNQVKVKVAA